MATNILLLLATCLLVGYCTAGLIPEHATAIISHPVQLDESPPQYEFHYSVHDSHTGDIKDQFEHRRGDYVTGRYSLIEPDGQRRIVDYSADPLLGFTAQVRRESPVIRSFPIGAQLHAVAGRRSDDGTQNVEKWPADESDRR